MASLAWLALLGSSQAAYATSNVGYNGGPVAHSMTGVLVDWGGGINSMYTNETSGDPGLIKYLAAQSGSTADIGGVLAQYMDSSGQNAANLASYGQQYQITPSITATTIYDSQIQTELVNQIGAGHLPHPAGDGLGTMYLVLFPNGDVECVNAQQCSANAPDQSTAVFCAYHNSTQLADGTYVLYAVLPDNTSGPMSQGCGNAPTLFGDQTSFLSHEWSETITDPLGNAWWVTDLSSPDYQNEIGDSCNQMMASEGGWTVQQEWSNRDAGCMSSEPAYLAPTASFLGPDVAAPGQSVSFDASSSTDPAQNNTAISGTGYSISSGLSSYTWNWGDGSSSTASTPTANHIYSVAGSYQVSLTVKDDLGFTSTVTHSLSISTSGSSDPAVTTGGTTSISATGATLEGGVNSENQSTQYQFVYGTSPGSMTSSTPLTPGPIGQVNTEVSATLSGLSPSTTYYYQLQLFAGGQTYLGSVQSFSTNSAPPPPQTPIAGTGGASLVGTASAMIAGTVNPGGAQPVTYRFSYGTSPGGLYSSTYPSSGLTGTTSVPVSSLLSGLSSHTTYYYRLDVSLGGQTFTGAVQSFTTRAVAPGVSTGAAGGISSNQATVTGTVSPGGVATSYLVEFGTTTSYGHSSATFSAGAGGGTEEVAATLSGLQSRTEYHYRLVAISEGGTSVGSDRTFTTSAPLPPPPRFGFGIPSSITLHGALTGKVKVHFRCSKRCSAHFTVAVAPGGIARLTPVAVTVARASGYLRRHGFGTVTIAFSPSIRGRLRHGKLKLVVLGYAVSPGSARTAPNAKLLTLWR